MGKKGKKQKRIMRELFTIIFTIVFVLTSLPVTEASAKTIVKTVTVGVGKTTTKAVSTRITSIKMANKKVATVRKVSTKKVKIIGKKAGSTTLTVTCQKEKVKFCVNVGATSIKNRTIPTSMTVGMTGTYKVSAKNATGDKFTWKSKNSKIVKVSSSSGTSNKLTALNVGATSIQVSSKNTKAKVTVKINVVKSNSEEPTPTEITTPTEPTVTTPQNASPTATIVETVSPAAATPTALPSTATPTALPSTATPTALPSTATPTGITTIAPTSAVVSTPAVTSTSVPKPTAEPVLYGTDERFAQGYPKLETDRDKGTYTITYKLKDKIASSASPAIVYYLATSLNSSCGVTVDSVLHGHVGIVNDSKHEIIQSFYSDTVRITDALEHKVVIPYDSIISDGLVIYSVLQTKDGKLSDLPSRIYLNKENADKALDNQGPVMDAVTINQARNKVYVYYYEELDEKSVPDVSAFYVEKLELDQLSPHKNYRSTGMKYTPADIRIINDKNNGDTFFEHFVELTFSTPLPQGDYKIGYVAPIENPLQDTNSSPNPAETVGGEILFKDDVKFIKDAQPQITNVWYSTDFQYISFQIIPAFSNLLMEQCTIRINGKEMERKRISYSYSGHCCNFKIKDTGLTEKPQTISITFENCNEPKTTAMDPLTEIICNEETIWQMDKKFEISNGYYSSTEQLIRVQLKLNETIDLRNLYECLFTLRVNGQKEYVLRTKRAPVSNDTSGNSEYMPFGIDYNFTDGGKNIYLTLDVDYLMLDTSEIQKMELSFSNNKFIDNGYYFVDYVSGKPLEDIPYFGIDIR